jgi:general secretion pathway protein C
MGCSAVAERREWAVAVAGGLALAAGLSWWWLDEEVAPVPPDLSLLTAVPVAEAVVAAPPVDVSELELRGVIWRAEGAAAVIGLADGGQRLVRVGGQVAPGVRLARVEAGRAVLAAGGDEVVLVLDPGLATAPVAGRGPAGVTDWRLALRAVREEGRIKGWAVREVAEVPLLARAGLVAGDVLLAVNGVELFSEEKLMEMPALAAGAQVVELEFRRGDEILRNRVAADR